MCPRSPPVGSRLRAALPGKEKCGVFVGGECITVAAQVGKIEILE